MSSDDFEIKESIKEEDAEDISDDRSSKEVLFIIGCSDKPVRKTRLQKLALLYDALYGGQNGSDRGAYFFGGFSDNIEEAAETMADDMILSEGEKGYRLTEYGEEIFGMLKKKDPAFYGEMAAIAGSTENVPDSCIVAMTYRYYPKLAENSLIKDSADRIIEGMTVNGRKLGDIPKEEFESMLRKGEKMEVSLKW
ncbi:MAG: hypothetical protein LKJ94_01860 [Candidatus Methanomethylophilus sp.]|jgi:hypothetical protein|nr:hypothetical protein [Methanomethylophilus sp.]MCI2074444.1 hypothetical protein [Methanomethylophilus sp.]MCI2092760.1 hypothetical protein [Methanomethylophilus sp.]